MIGRLLQHFRGARSRAIDARWMLENYPDCTSMKQARAYATNLEALISGKISRDEWRRRELAIDARYNGKGDIA